MTARLIDPRPLPSIEPLHLDLQNPIVQRDELIHGVLRCGRRLVLGGGSKTFKTWALMDMGLSLAAGTDWWGFPTKASKTLYLNLELEKMDFLQRAADILEAKDIPVPSNFDAWHLENHVADWGLLSDKLLAGIEQVKYEAIILDPLYMALGARDENSAGDMTDLMNRIKRFAYNTGAAIIYAAHFSKGNQAQKEAMDRIAGSGVHGRHPDAIVTVTAHEAEQAFTVDLTLRSFPPVPSFVIKREHPLMVRATDLDPNELRAPPKIGRPKAATSSDVLDLIRPGELLTRADLFARVGESLGLSFSAFRQRLKELAKSGLIHETNGLYSNASARSEGPLSFKQP